MEIDIGAPMHRAIVTKKIVTYYTVKLHVRYFRKNFFAKKREEFEVLIRRGYDYEPRQTEKYYEARKLRPGDELYIDAYGREWSNPTYRSKLRRKWNLIFA